MPPMPEHGICLHRAGIQLVPMDIAVAFLVGFGASVVAAMGPARKMSRLSIVDALARNI